MESPQAPRVMYLLGGGRSATLAARRASRFDGRTLRIGDLVVRPQRRIAVTVDFVKQYAAEISAYITSGALVLQHDADNFVDIEELKSLVGGSSKPVVASKPVAAPAVVAAPPAAPVAPLAPPPAPEPVVAEETAEEPVEALAEGWERSTKKELLAMCIARGLEASESDTNRQLVATLRAWEDQQF